MTTPADRIIAALRSGHDQLTALVRDLTPADLTRPSGASEWSVSQVLSHLGSGAEINMAILDAASTGAPGPDGESNKKVWARWDAMPPVEHADGFRRVNQELVERYEDLDPAAQESLRIETGFLPEPVDVATVVGFRLIEFALHQWDVEVAFNSYAVLAPEAVPSLLDAIQFPFGFLGRPAEFDGRQATLAVLLTGPDQSYGLRLGDRIELTDVPDQPDGELIAPAESWLRLITGRLAPERTPDGVTVAGPVSLDELRRVFPGF